MSNICGLSERERRRLKRARGLQIPDGEPVPGPDSEKKAA